MGFKQFIGLSIFIGDLFLIIWLISAIGVKTSAYFMLSYIIFTFVSSLILLLLFKNLSNTDLWEEAYQARIESKKSGYWRYILMVTIVIVSMLSTRINNPAWIAGMSSASVIVLIWLLLCKDTLYVITKYIETFEDIIYESKIIKRFIK